MIEKVKDITFSNGGKIGVSDTLDNYTLDEIKNYLYCASYAKKYSGFEQDSPKAKSPFLSDDWQTLQDIKTPFTYKSTSYNPYNPNQIRAYVVESGIQEEITEYKWIAVIFFYKDDNTFSMPIALDSHNTNLNKIRIATNFDSNKICNNIDTLTTTYYQPFGNYGIPTSWNDDKHPFMCKSHYYIYNTKDDMINKTNGSLIGLYPYAVIEKDNRIYFFDYYNFITNRMAVVNWNKLNSETYDYWLIGYDYNVTKRMAYIYSCVVDTRFYWFAPRNEGSTHTDQSVTDLKNWLTYYSNGQDWDYDFEQYIAPCTLDEWNEYNSVCGLYFRTDKLYKPVILENAVIGYTDDLTEQSDIDNYTYDTGNKHEVPDKPPIDDRDSIEPIHTRSFSELTGFTKYYKMTSERLDTFINACQQAGSVKTGFEYMPYITSVKQYPFNVNNYVSTEDHASTIKINGLTLDGSYVTAEGITATGHKLSGTQLPINNIGTVHIPRRHNNFLDYAPYTTIEVYIPLCGWTTLPSHCMDNDISVVLIMDVINGTCKGEVYCNRVPVAEKAGICGRDIALSGIETGLKTASVVSSASGLASSALGLASGVMTGNPVSVGYSAVSAISATSQMLATMNNSHTRTTGNMGDITNFHDSSCCYLKITTPVNKLPESYGKNVGYVCNKTKQLSTCKGYTVIENPELNLNCNFDEEQEIKTLLQAGIIVK